MTCPQCGRDLGLFDAECPCCHGKGIAPEPEGQENAALPAVFQGNVFAIALPMTITILGASLLYYLIFSISIHQEFDAAEKFGRNSLSLAIFHLKWWLGMAFSIFLLNHGSRQVVQALRKQP